MEASSAGTCKVDNREAAGSSRAFRAIRHHLDRFSLHFSSNLFFSQFSPLLFPFPSCFCPQNPPPSSFRETGGDACACAHFCGFFSSFAESGNVQEDSSQGSAEEADSAEGTRASAEEGSSRAEAGAGAGEERNGSFGGFDLPRNDGNLE